MKHKLKVKELSDVVNEWLIEPHYIKHLDDEKGEWLVSISSLKSAIKRLEEKYGDVTHIKLYWTSGSDIYGSWENALDEDLCAAPYKVEQETPEEKTERLRKIREEDTKRIERELKEERELYERLKRKYEK